MPRFQVYPKHPFTWRDSNHVRHALLVLSMLPVVSCARGSDVARSSFPLDTVSYDGLVSGSVGGRDAFAPDVRVLPAFAGVYVDGCDVVVLLAPATSAASAAAKLHYAGQRPSTRDGQPCSGTVTVRSVRYTWAELSHWYHDRLRLQPEKGVTVHALNMVRNRIVVGVHDAEAQEYVERRLRRSGIPRDAALIAYTPPLPPAPAPYRLLFNVAEIHSLRPVAGVRIRVSGPATSTTEVITVANGRAETTLPGRGSYTIELGVPSGYILAPGVPNPQVVEI